MAREPEPRVRAEHFSEAREEPDPSAHHLISNTMAAILIVWSLILDIADYFGAGEVLITDLACVLTTDLYLLYKGMSPIRMFGGQVLEIIPVVGDILPAYTGGIIFTILQDRSAAVAKVAQAIPKKNPGGRVAGTATQTASRIRQTSARVIAKTEQAAKKYQELQKRLSGPLRSIPGQNTKRQEGVPEPHAQAVAQRNTQTAVPTPPGQAGRKASGAGNPFFDATYGDLLKNTLPSLEDIESDIDVTGALTAARAERKTHTPEQRNQVQ